MITVLGPRLDGEQSPPRAAARPRDEVCFAPAQATRTRHVIGQGSQHSVHAGVSVEEEYLAVQRGSGSSSAPQSRYWPRKRTSRQQMSAQRDQRPATQATEQPHRTQSGKTAAWRPGSSPLDSP